MSYLFERVADADYYEEHYPEQTKESLHSTGIK